MESPVPTDAIVLEKGKGGGGAKRNSLDFSDSKMRYPQNGSRIFRIQSEFAPDSLPYQGGNFMLPNGSTFHLKGAALTAPPGYDDMDPVKIEMHVDRDPVSDQLIFTFGPHGSKFDPPAEVWFDYTDLETNRANLYYINDEGEYVLQQPDDVDRKGQRLKLLIHHFSRYALAHSQ